jgi:hypothetical protein
MDRVTMFQAYNLYEPDGEECPAVGNEDEPGIAARPEVGAAQEPEPRS